MRVVVRIALAFVALILVAAVLAWAWMQRSLPRLDGEVTAKALEHAVEIVRDPEGVPHLFAKGARDGWFAMGYVHAQDRLWQMEFQRRIAQGRLAEFLGERAYDVDRLMRTLGIARISERVVARLDPETLANLEAYAAGVNAVLDADPVLPVEFQVFRIKPARWKPADTMGWLFVMAWDLSSNWRSELARVRFAAKLGPERAAQFLPPYPGDTEPPVPDFHALYVELEPLAGKLLAATPPHEEAIGSNNWVVSGDRSETGKPLLANDPHLGLQAPSLWYLAHVSTSEGNVIGGTLPGVPFIVLGRNDNLAWTFTTTNSDTQDLFVEKTAPGDAASYVTPSGTAKFEKREEVIRVGSEERRIVVRTTRHGPVISDVVKSAATAAPDGHVLALAWAALTEESTVARAGFALNAARDVPSLMAALRYLTAPHQNIVYADREGHIGMIAPARLPVRSADNEAMGRVPVPGWIAKYDWQGFLPFEEMPQVADPPTGSIVTANNKITPPGYKPFVSVDWFPPYRADRIEEMLAATPKHSLDSFARMQGDTLSRLARELLPLATSVHPATDGGRKAQALLSGWNGDMKMDAAAPLAFTAWYRELSRLVYADELGDLFAESWELRAAFMLNVLKGGQESWCDDVRTAERETCAMMAARAFDLAAADLGHRYGEAHSWNWGAAHAAAGDHRPFGVVPFIAHLFNVAPRSPGDSYSVDVGGITIRDNERPFANRHAPSLRAIYDLADLDRSRYMHSTGQSGNVLSPWYANLGDRWARVEYVTIPARRDAIIAAHRLLLNPWRAEIARDRVHNGSSAVEGAPPCPAPSAPRAISLSTTAGHSDWRACAAACSTVPSVSS